MDQLLQSTESVLRYSSTGQMTTGLMPGLTVAATGDKRFHFNCSKRGAGE
tara:strand:- start:357 stop:506 length:150 start_codon:yes stop_codon:yes gene_type:complete